MSEPMTHRALCMHGKVRALMMAPLEDAPPDRRHLASKEYAKDFKREKASWGRWAHTIDCVPVEEARKSDMNCPDCDAKRKGSKQ